MTALAASDWTSGSTLVGTFHDLLDPWVIEVSGHAGFDFVVIEWEHGLRNPETIQHLIRTAEARDVTPLVRVGLSDQRLTEHALDAGARGLLFARIDTADDARRAVAFSRYPPQGSRGTGFRRGRLMAYDDAEMEQLSEDNAAVAVFAIIETKSGVENIDAILEVDGLTGVLAGPADLGLDMGGLPMSHPDVGAALERVRSAVAARVDRCLMAPCGSGEQARRQRDGGAGALLVFHDSYLVGNLYSGLSQEIRTALGAGFR